LAAVRELHNKPFGIGKSPFLGGFSHIEDQTFVDAVSLAVSRS